MHPAVRGQAGPSTHLQDRRLACACPSRPGPSGQPAFRGFGLKRRSGARRAYKRAKSVRGKMYPIRVSCRSSAFGWRSSSRGTLLQLHHEDGSSSRSSSSSDTYIPDDLRHGGMRVRVLLSTRRWCWLSGGQPSRSQPSLISILLDVVTPLVSPDSCNAVTNELWACTTSAQAWQAIDLAYSALCAEALMAYGRTALLGLRLPAHSSAGPRSKKGQVVLTHLQGSPILCLRFRLACRWCSEA